MDALEDRSMLDALPAATLVLGTDRRIALANPAACRLLRSPEAALVGLPIERVLPGAGGMRAGGDSPAIARGGDGREMSVEVASGRLAPVDGALEVLVLREATPVDNARGATAAVLASKIARHRRERPQSTPAQTPTAKEERRRYLANMGHEFRTPMTTILGNAHLLLNDPRSTLSPDARDDVAAITDAVKRLLDLTNGAIDLSRLEAGLIEIAAEPLDLCPLLEESWAKAAPRATAKGIDLRLDQAPAPPAMADPLRVRQILGCLVDNALTHTERGQVALRSRRVGAWVEVVVADTGGGIPDCTLPHIFDAFPTSPAAGADPSRRASVRGIGLALTKKLVDLHGGVIRIDSEPGVGTTVTVRLPAAIRPSVAAPNGRRRGLDRQSGSAAPRYDAAAHANGAPRAMPHPIAALAPAPSRQRGERTSRRRRNAAVA